jgi:hypothetical protein
MTMWVSLAIENIAANPLRWRMERTRHAPTSSPKTTLEVRETWRGPANVRTGRPDNGGPTLRVTVGPHPMCGCSFGPEDRP